MRTQYRIDDFQETYFVIESLDELLELAHIDFAPLYGRVAKLPEYEARSVLSSDQVYTRGTGAYHEAKRRAAAA